MNVNRIDGIYYQFAKRIGVKENTLALFYALRDGKPHSQKEICDEWMIPRSTLNTIVQECTVRGHIRFEKSKCTKEKVLRLTNLGEKYADEFMNELFAIEKAVFSETVRQYGNEFVNALSFFTDKLEKQVLYDKKE